jgi:hypothetical protein
MYSTRNARHKNAYAAHLFPCNSFFYSLPPSSTSPIIIIIIIHLPSSIFHLPSSIIPSTTTLSLSFRHSPFFPFTDLADGPELVLSPECGSLSEFILDPTNHFLWSPRLCRQAFIQSGGQNHLSKQYCCFVNDHHRSGTEARSLQRRPFSFFFFGVFFSFFSLYRVRNPSLISDLAAFLGGENPLMVFFASGRRRRRRRQALWKKKKKEKAISRWDDDDGREIIY